jgi:GTPase SAR1 family protein
MNPKQENSQVGDLNAMTGKDLKLLLLGAGESGKSTIYKQIRILKNKNYDKEDLEQFATAIKTNVIISIKALVEACSTLKIEIKTQENKDFAEKIKKWEEDNYGNIIKDFDETYAEKLSNLWEDIGIQSALEHRSKYQLLDSTEYFFENLKKICSREYIPSNEDILRCRVKTIGIVNVEFQEADIKYKIFDVGGQRNERRKWIHCFDNVNAIIFVVSLMNTI